MSTPNTPVSNDFVLVPREPTPKMVAATWDHEIDREGGLESQNTRNKRIYAAMLAAAPASPEPASNEAPGRGGVGHERIAAGAASSLKPELFEPAIRKVTDDLYNRLLTSVQDYLIDNTQWNISAQLDSYKNEADRHRALAPELREARTTLSILRTQVMVEIEHGRERWEGVPEKLKERLDSIDTTLATAGIYL